MDYKKNTILLITCSALLHAIVACTTELGNDEVYYRLYASNLQWNYFDHPPMVGYLIRLTTANLLFDTEFFIRLGAIISSAIATWFIYKSGRSLANSYTGFLAACIYSVSIYGSVIAGIFILPDSPQMVFWMAGLYLLIEITGSGIITPRKSNQILLFGIIVGLGMLCKIHTIFLWIGFILYIVLHNREWLSSKALYLSAAITLVCFIPVMKWNIENDFISFFYHGNRVNIADNGFDISNFLVFTAGQFFIAIL